MLKIVFLLATALYAVNAQVAVWQQCGGRGYTGRTDCASGNTCVVENEWYHQCRPSTQNPTTTTTPRPQSSTTVQPTTRPSSGTGRCNFINGRFRYGAAFDGAGRDYSSFDYISIWLNTLENGNGKTDFNPWWQGEMVRTAQRLNKIPVFYGYIIAFEARYRQGLQDCDVNPTFNLCHKGANFIRQNEDLLVSRYAHHAAEIAKILGRDATAVFKMEPDFWQYYGDRTQEGGPLSGDFMRRLFDRFVGAIKQHLPNACISWDISAWIGEQGFRTW
jgi:hypothetical protein